ncbi:MAG: hypothetical protein ACLR3M_02425 [Collinsella sp.]
MELDAAECIEIRQNNIEQVEKALLRAYKAVPRTREDGPHQPTVCTVGRDTMPYDALATVVA